MKISVKITKILGIKMLKKFGFIKENIYWYFHPRSVPCQNNCFYGFKPPCDTSYPLFRSLKHDKGTFFIVDDETTVRHSIKCLLYRICISVEKMSYWAGRPMIGLEERGGVLGHQLVGHWTTVVLLSSRVLLVGGGFHWKLWLLLCVLSGLRKVLEERSVINLQKYPSFL